VNAKELTEINLSALKICVAESKEKGFSKYYEKDMKNSIKIPKFRQTCGQLKKADFVENIKKNSRSAYAERILRNAENTVSIDKKRHARSDYTPRSKQDLNLRYPSENIVATRRSIHSLLWLLVFVTRFAKKIINRFCSLTLAPEAEKICFLNTIVYI